MNERGESHTLVCVNRSIAAAPPNDAPAATPAEAAEVRTDPADATIAESDTTARETASVESAPDHADADDPATSDASRLGLRRSDQLVLGTVIAMALALMAVHWARLGGWGMRPIEIERQPPLVFEHRLDVNAADRLDWTQLPGIGETLADRIVADRETHGPFDSIDELRRVKGIGPKTIEALRPWLRVGGDVP